MSSTNKKKCKRKATLNWIMEVTCTKLKKLPIFNSTSYQIIERKYGKIKQKQIL